MTDGRPAGASHAAAAWKLSGHAARAFLCLLAFFSLCPRAPSAHEVIDAEQVRAALAAVDAADARAKNAAGSATEGEAKLVLGLVQAETTDILNRDLAAHSGRLSFNGDLLQKSLLSAICRLPSTTRSAATGCRAPRSRKRFGFRPRHPMRRAPALRC